MGNDGGSIPTRRELVKSPTRRPTHSQLRDATSQSSTYHWSTCPLSKRPLASPVVSDSLGRLFNKDSILEWLLRGTEAFGDGVEVLDGKVKGLRDVVEVKFELLPIVDDAGKTDKEKEREREREGSGDGEKWVCPVSQKELGPSGGRAVYLVPCGHAFAESAVKEVGGERVCLQCNTPYTPSNIIPINPTDPTTITLLESRLKSLSEQGLTHSLKTISKPKSKSKKRKPPQDPSTSSISTSTSTTTSSLKNSTTASLTTKVLQDEKVRAKRRKTDMSENVKSLFSKEKGDGEFTGGGGAGGGDFMTRGFTISGRR